jgi:hypothetical protein
MAVESFSFLSVSCGQVFLIGSARIAFIAGLVAVDADHAGGASSFLVLLSVLPSLLLSLGTSLVLPSLETSLVLMSLGKQ